MAGGSSNHDIFNNKPAKGTTEKKKRKRPSKKVPTTVLEANSNNFMNLVQKLTGSAAELAAAKDAANQAAPKSTSPSPYPSPYSSPSNHTNQQDDSQQHHRSTSESYYQQYLRSSNNTEDGDRSGSSPNYSYNPAPYSSAPYTQQDVGNMGSQMDHYQQYNAGTSSNYGYNNYSSHGAGGYVGSGRGSRVDGDDQDHDLYQNYSGRSNDTSDHFGYPSSSRAMENDISPLSWRDPMNHNSTSDYWYQVDPMPAMRAS